MWVLEGLLYGEASGPVIGLPSCRNSTSSMSPGDRSRVKSSLILLSSYLPKPCETPEMIFDGYSRWMGHLTSWAAARKIKKNSSRFTLIDGELYRSGFTHSLLVCVHGEKCVRIMAEFHEGICGSHIGGRALATRTLRAGYYWPTMREDCKSYAQRCKQCQ